MRSDYEHDRSAEIAFHLKRGSVILYNKEVGIVVRHKGRFIGLAEFDAEAKALVIGRPLTSGVVFHGVRIAEVLFLDSERVKLIPCVKTPESTV